MIAAEVAVSNALFFALWAFAILFVVVLVFYFIMEPIHEKQYRLQKEIKDNYIFLENLKNGK